MWSPDTEPEENIITLLVNEYSEVLPVTNKIERLASIQHFIAYANAYINDPANTISRIEYINGAPAVRLNNGKAYYLMQPFEQIKGSMSPTPDVYNQGAVPITGAVDPQSTRVVDYSRHNKSGSIDRMQQQPVRNFDIKQQYPDDLLNR